VLIVELEGETEQVEAEFAALKQVIDASGAYAVQVAQDDAERTRIWKGRKGAFSSVGRLSPDYVVQDGVVPRGSLGKALTEIDRLSRAYGLDVANVFHAGDGNLHPLILYDGKVKGALEHAEKLAGEILKLCVDLGGSITGEHGVGMEKRDYMATMFSETDLDIMHAIRLQLDPKTIANPGKMFPGGEAPALSQHGMHPLEEQGVISRE
jgi:glycolate oxidase